MVCGTLWVSCAPKTASLTVTSADEPHQFYTLDKKMIVQADSLFREAQYEIARMQYTKIRNEFPQTPSGAQAQYNLGYINIFFDNPFADYNAGLREFKRFQTDYPKDKRITVVNNWIRLLTVLKDFDQGYARNEEQLKALKDKQKGLMKNFGTLQDVYMRYDVTIDSLKSHIKKLEGIIDYLDSDSKRGQ
jgi:outer membrane protein assembly factor BamD (BamD/ComL family)